MAIALVRNSGHVATTASVGGEISVPITAGEVGNMWSVALVATTTKGASEITDSVTDTFQKDAAESDGVSVNTELWSSIITSKAVTSLTVKGLGASTIVEVSVFEFSGIAASGRLVSPGGNEGTGTSVKVVTNEPLLETDAWIAAFGSTASSGSFTPGGSATGLTGASQVGGTLGAEYLLKPTKSVKGEATGTFSISASWTGVIAAYVAATAPIVSLNAGQGSSGASLGTTAPTKLALNSSGGVSEGILGESAPTQVSLSTGAGFSSSSIGVSAPTRIGIRASTGQSEAGAPSIEPSEELEPGEEFYPGQEDLPLTVSTFIQIVAGASSSTGSMGITAPAKLSLSAEGVSSGSLSDTAPTQIQLNNGSASSSGSLSTTTPAQISLNISTSSSSATVGFTTPGFLVLSSSGQSVGIIGITANSILSASSFSGISKGSFQANAPTALSLGISAGESEAGASQVEPGEELYPSEELYPGQNVLFIAPSWLSLEANSTSGASLRATTTVSLPLNGANATSSASVVLVVYQYLSLENGYGVSSSGLVLTRFVRGEADITVSLVYHAAIGVKVLYKAVPEIMLV